MLGAALAAATSCDAGKQDDQKTVGPAITILGASVGPDRPMPADGEIQISFDRYLLPATVNRQSIGVLDAANMPLPAPLAPIVIYDPIARTVTLSRPQAEWLTVGQSYKLVLGVPEPGAEQGGVRAIDGATLFPPQQREFGFIVGPPSGAQREPAVSFCRDVRPIFLAKCSLSTCHGSEIVPGIEPFGAAAGLLLDTSKGVAATALNRIAQGSNTGPRASDPPSAGRVFGVDMPIIDPGNPGNSWLVYKVELARPPVQTAEPPPCLVPGEAPAGPFAFQPLVPVQRAADETERFILSNFILGREMPFPGANRRGYSNHPLTFEEREKLRIWIKNLRPGEAIPECPDCVAPPEPVDAGADAGATDAADQ